MLGLYTEDRRQRGFQLLQPLAYSGMCSLIDAFFRFHRTLLLVIDLKAIDVQYPRRELHRECRLAEIPLGSLLSS